MANIQIQNRDGSWEELYAIKGTTGITPDITMEAVTLDPGSNAYVQRIGGTAENPVFRLGIPRGDQGESLADGATKTELNQGLDKKLDKAGGDVTGHVYLTGAVADSSTASTSQIVFGTTSNNHVAISSNVNAVIINPTTDSTAGQIVLDLDEVSEFPAGIRTSTVTGNLSGTASRATADASGNVITTTYATKAELASKVPTSHASSDTTYGAGNGSNYGHVKLSDATNSTSTASEGVAATPAAVKAVYDLANGAVKSVNGITPVNGNVELQVSTSDEVYTGDDAPTDSGIKIWVDTDEADVMAVTSVNGVKPNENGNLTLDLPSSVHVGSEVPTNQTISVWVDTDDTIPNSVVTVNGISADLNGNVNIEVPSPTAYVVETYSSGKSWYRKWSDGWIEQGGYASSSPTTLVIPFTKSTYSLIFGSDGTYYKQEHWEAKSQTTTSFTYAGWLPTLPYWEARGY